MAHEQAEAALRQSEADLAEAQRVAKLGSWRFDLTTNAGRWSKELYRIFEIDQPAFGGMYEAFLGCIHPDDRPRVLQANAEAREGGKPFELEYRVLTRTGQVKTIREVGYAVKDAAGKIVGLFGTAQDITERKLAEEALQQTNARLQMILEASPIPILGVTPDGRIESWNAAAERVFGWSAKEVIGRLCPTIGPEEMQDYLAMIRRAMRGEPSLGLVRYRQKKGGSLLLCRVSAAPQHNTQGQPVGVTFLLEDITEQAQAEKALRESEARLRLLDDNLPDSYVYQYMQEVDGTPRFLYLSVGVERVHGVKAEAALRDASTLRRQVTPELLTGLVAAEAASLRDLSDFEMEVSICRPDGQWRWVQLRSRPRQTSDGQVIWDGVATDITERKRAEEAVRGSQQLLHLVLATLPVGVAVTDRAGNIVLANAASKRIWGGTIVSGRERWTQTKAFWHDSGERIAAENWASVRALSEGQTSLNELIDIETYDGQQKTILNSSAPIRNSDGVIVGAVFVNEDVTERVRAEEALRESEERFSNAFKNAAIGMALVAPEGRLFQVNRPLCEYLGYSEAELLTATFQSLTHPEDLEKDLAYVRRMLSGEIQTYQMEKRYFHKSGDIVWGLLSVSLVRNSRGTPLYFISQVQNITEHKQAETALIESETKFRVLANGTASAIFIYRGDRYCYVNPAFQAITGYSEAELLGMNFWDMAHPEFQELVRTRGLARQQGKHPPVRYEFKILTKSGEERWLDFTDGVIEFQGRPAAVGTALDITERKQAELEAQRSRAQLRALLVRLERLREEERTRMAREVHDVLGQLLTALKMDMAWWERRFTKITDEPLRRSLEEKVEATSRLTDRMIETVQRISHELRPSVLDNIGLGAALQFEAREFKERTGIACEVSVPSVTFSLEPDRATGIFRVFQELLTNVARHAQASRVSASLGQTAEHVMLEVKDNGRGIREEELRDPKSLGILGMAERASLMGGRLEIHGATGSGTTATLTIPAKFA